MRNSRQFREIAAWSKYLVPPSKRFPINAAKLESMLRCGFKLDRHNYPVKRNPGTMVHELYSIIGGLGRVSRQSLLNMKSDKVE
jgi:hypothetical protein